MERTSVSFGVSKDLIKMKVFVAVILAIGSASAIGSGPYLPSGWRPTGPAFYLPSEVQKPADNPIKETLYESEASGSEGLREYGPPKVQEEEPRIVQGLPDVVTDQTFYVADAVEPFGEQVAEVLTEKAEIIQITEAEAVTEARSLDFELETEVSTASYVTETVTDAGVTGQEVVEAVDELKEIEASSAALEGKLEAIAIKEETLENAFTQQQNLQNVVLEQTLENLNQEQKLESIIIQEEKIENIVQEGKQENFVQELKLGNIQAQEENVETLVVETVGEVKNIAEALVNLENEIKDRQTYETAEIRTAQEGSGNAQLPEGFLEYGPPGFREYGPPKGADLLRTIEDNEVRRRRFSPKFRSLKKNN